MEILNRPTCGWCCHPSPLVWLKARSFKTSFKQTLHSLFSEHHSLRHTWATWSSCCSVYPVCTRQWVCLLFCCSDIWREAAGNVLRHHADLRGSVHLRRDQRLPVHLLQVSSAAPPAPSCSNTALLRLLTACLMFPPAGCVSLEPERVTCPACWPWSIIRTAHPSLPCWSAYVQPHIEISLISVIASVRFDICLYTDFLKSVFILYIFPFGNCFSCCVC